MPTTGTDNGSGTTLFIGNCQASTLADTETMHGEKTKKFIFRSTVYSGVSMKDIKDSFLQYMDEEAYQGMRSSGRVLFLPSGKDVQDIRPDVIVVNLFHEGRCFMHTGNLGAIHLGPKVFSTLPEPLQQHINAEYRVFFLQDPYFKRMLIFLSGLRQILPEVPIVLLSRVKPDEFFDPGIYQRSFLADWDDMSAKVDQYYGFLRSKVGNLHVLDTSRVGWGFINQGWRPERLFSSYNGSSEDDVVSIAPDIEHFASAVNERLAAMIREFRRTGELNYLPHETASRSGPPQRGYEPLGAEDIGELLASPDYLEVRSGLCHALLRLPEDNFGLLKQHAATLPMDEHAVDLLLKYALFRESTMDEGAEFAGVLMDNIARTLPASSVEYTLCMEKCRNFLSRLALPEPVSGQVGVAPAIKRRQRTAA